MLAGGMVMVDLIVLGAPWRGATPAAPYQIESLGERSLPLTPSRTLQFRIAPA
jgi:hypothetical protein